MPFKMKTQIYFIENAVETSKTRKRCTFFEREQLLNFEYSFLSLSFSLSWYSNPTQIVGKDLCSLAVSKPIALHVWNKVALTAQR